jgi:hypothetical protein
MDFECHGKIGRSPSAEIYTVVFKIYILSFRFHKIFFVCEYKLWGSGQHLFLVSGRSQVRAAVQELLPIVVIED